jgi:D-tagatose-1,6-bisphosphate aldolase subunit GatZ/KbaZ
MKKSGDLVAACVHAGYAKIHLDASMPLGGDTAGRRGLDPRAVAEREAELATCAEAAFAERLLREPDATAPVYVIGTEVPPPGGIVSADDPVPVTRVGDLLETVGLCREAFHRRGLDEAWQRVCAVVAQPGVEYGDQEIHEYDPGKSAALCRTARESTDLVMEGHSTDYQRPAALKRLVEDGVAILKVGPALTFALRECFFGLESIEREVLIRLPGARPSRLAETLERAMMNDPSHWKGYYAGDEARQRFARRYSFSDRVRYYWSVPAVVRAVETLLVNLTGGSIPLPLLSQHLPLQYRAVREGLVAPDPAALLRESVCVVLRQYSAAVRGE